MTVALDHFKAKRGPDTEDLALSFLENEVGRHSWQRNWPKWKEQFKDQNALLKRIQRWLNYIQVDHNPQEIVDYLDRMMEERLGKWL